jgi:hypothetical protein
MEKTIPDPHNQNRATVPMTPEQVVNRANTVDRVQTDLAAQRARVATNGVVNNLPRECTI